MQLREFYTVLCTDDVAGTAAFWESISVSAVSSRPTGMSI